jgi:hypothetical protein
LLSISCTRLYSKSSKPHGFGLFLLSALADVVRSGRLANRRYTGQDLFNEPPKEKCMKTTRRYATLMFAAALLSVAGAVSAQSAPAAPSAPLDIEALTARSTPETPAAPSARELPNMDDLHFVTMDIQLSAPAKPAPRSAAASRQSTGTSAAQAVGSGMAAAATSVAGVAAAATSGAVVGAVGTVAGIASAAGSGLAQATGSPR